MIGSMLYLAIIPLIFYRLTFIALAHAEFSPPYWINMGAVAITTVAGSLLILHAGAWRLLAELRPFIAGLTLLFWAVATWWLPLLVGLSLWRHVVRRLPLGYDPQLWAVAFPLGMYTVATLRLSAALDLPFLAAIPAASIYVALAVWMALAVGLLVTLWRRAARALLEASA
jgi:tellurite resistance protein TehA-like permease